MDSPFISFRQGSRLFGGPTDENREPQKLEGREPRKLSSLLLSPLSPFPETPKPKLELPPLLRQKSTGAMAATALDMLIEEMRFETLKGAFDRFDLDSDGVLSQEEVDAALQSIGVHFTPSQLTAFLRMGNARDDRADPGCLSEHEFLAMVRRARRGHSAASTGPAPGPGGKAASRAPGPKVAPHARAAPAARPSVGTNKMGGGGGGTGFGPPPQMPPQPPQMPQQQQQQRRRPRSGGVGGGSNASTSPSRWAAASSIDLEERLYARRDQTSDYRPNGAAALPSASAHHVGLCAAAGRRLSASSPSRRSCAPSRTPSSSGASAKRLARCARARAPDKHTRAHTSRRVGYRRRHSHCATLCA